MNSCPAEQGPDQPIEVTEELAEQVRAVGADTNVPIESLAYVLAHPDADLVEIVSAAEHDHGAAVRWLGRVISVAGPEVDDTFARYIYREPGNESEVPALLKLLQALHANENVPQPPSRIEPPLRTETPEPERSAVLRIHDGASKTATARQYLAIVDTARATVSDLSATSERQQHGLQAKAGLDAFLTAVVESDDATQDYVTSRVRAFVAEVAGVSYGEMSRVVPGCAAAVTLIHDVLERYVDTVVESDRRIRSVRALPLRIDRLLLNMLEVESGLVAAEMDIREIAVNMSNANVKLALRQLFAHDPELGWVAWKDGYLTADKLPGKSGYLEGLRERYSTFQTPGKALGLDSWSPNEEAVLDVVLGAPLTAEEEMYYAGRPDDLYLKRLADYGEVLIEKSIDHFGALMMHGETFAASLLDIDQLDYPMHNGEVDRMVWHGQACLEVCITAVANYLEANPRSQRTEQTWRSLRAFWLSLFTPGLERRESGDGLEYELARHMPNTRGMVYNRANYHLRHLGRMLVRERYPLVGNTEGSMALTPKELLLSPETPL